MKTGNYQGYSDRGYKRNATNNGDRLINGLVLSGPTRQEDETPDIPTPEPDYNNYIVHQGVQLAYIGTPLVYNR